MSVSANAEFDRLFEQAAPRLLLFVELRLGRALRARVEADDVVQEAYLAGLAGFGPDAPRSPRAFAAWMARVAENCVRGLADHFAARKRTPAGDCTTLTAILGRVRARDTGPATAVSRVDEGQRLRTILSALPDEQREALLQRYFAELDLETIAVRMGRSPSSVRRLLAKATARLGAELLPDGGSR
ncbi:MAG: sigma-70 family RNA polymerase sigma factor [Planctomycetota bacterium]